MPGREEMDFYHQTCRYIIRLFLISLLEWNRELSRLTLSSQSEVIGTYEPSILCSSCCRSSTRDADLVMRARKHMGECSVELISIAEAGYRSDGHPKY